jgi:hypothetical protein
VRKILICLLAIVFVCVSLAERASKRFRTQEKAFHNVSSVTGTVTSGNRFAPIVAPPVAVFIKTINFDWYVSRVDGADEAVRQQVLAIGVVSPNRMSANRRARRALYAPMFGIKFLNWPIMEGMIYFRWIKRQLNCAESYRQPSPNVEIARDSIARILEVNIYDSDMTAGEQLPIHEFPVWASNGYVGSLRSLELSRSLFVLQNHLLVHATVSDGVDSDNHQGEDFYAKQNPLSVFATTTLGFVLTWWSFWNIGSALKGLCYRSPKRLIFASVAGLIGPPLFLYGVSLILQWDAWRIAS